MGHAMARNALQSSSLPMADIAEFAEFAGYQSVSAFSAACPSVASIMASSSWVSWRPIETTFSRLPNAKFRDRHHRESSWLAQEIGQQDA